jgi:cyclic pyranopterin phosphate synthase
MPLGHVDDRRVDQYVALDTVRDALASRFTLVPSAYRTGGPARYYEVRETGRRLGLITPMSNNFCDGCNRIRLTVDGRLYMCLGHDDQIDLKSAYRDGGVAALDAAIDAALGAKPLRHTFRIGAGTGPALDRHMSVTGG